jgi:hypothetical protein
MSNEKTARCYRVGCNKLACAGLLAVRVKVAAELGHGVAYQQVHAMGFCRRWQWTLALSCYYHTTTANKFRPAAARVEGLPLGRSARREV